MKRLIAAAATAALLIAFSSTAEAVSVYLTANQGGDTAAGGTNFINPDVAEVDLIGDTGSLVLGAGSHTVNLWIDTQGDTLTLLGLRLEISGGTFDAYFGGSTMGGNLVPTGNAAINNPFLTVSDIDFSGGCNNLGLFPFPGFGQGSCVEAPPGGATPDQSAPMLMGTIDLTLTGSSISIGVGPLSSFIGNASEEIFFTNKLLAGAAAPEPLGMVLLGMGLASLAFVRRRS